MSSRGEINISLKLIICKTIQLKHQHSIFIFTFSCINAFNNLSSRQVLFASTGAENGFMIFLIATFIPVNWSLAELHNVLISSLYLIPITYHTKPNAPIPTGCRSTYLYLRYQRLFYMYFFIILPCSHFKHSTKNRKFNKFSHLQCIILIYNVSM